MAMADRPDHVYTPWLEEQIRSLNDYQVSGVFHPYTCGNCREKLGIFFILEDEVLRKATNDDFPPIDSLLYGPDNLDGLADNERKIIVNERLLVATTEGWVCPTCDYQQTWAWGWSADDSWRKWERKW